MDSYTLELDSAKFISVNEQYIHPVRRCNDGRYRSYVVRSPYLKEVQQFYDEEFKRIPDEVVKDFQDYVSQSSENGLEIYIEIGMPKSQINENDSSNYIKAVEDCLSERLKIDDSHNITVSASKSIVRDTADLWKLRLTITKTTLSNFSEIGPDSTS